MPPGPSAGAEEAARHPTASSRNPESELEHMNLYMASVDNERAQIYCLQLQNRSVDNNSYNNKGHCKCNCNCNVGVLQSANCDKAWP
ncbi:GD25766 [Drosophila simulans]|uniref:GD25766 n=1 Tax=Drosophila simulans TaxID=7240 RepID=B4QED0_DROSI|nr:GD25766 [Drosophila simulans]